MSQPGKDTLVPAFNHLSVSSTHGAEEDGTRPSMVSNKNSGEDDGNLTRTKSSGKCLYHGERFDYGS